MIANLEGTPSQIRVTNLPDRVQAKILDETNALEAMKSPEQFRQQSGQMLETEAWLLEIRNETLRYRAYRYHRSIK